MSEPLRATDMELLSRELRWRGPARAARFAAGRTGVLFFSRGRGRGHAIPDIGIAEELRRIRADLDVLFVSYATGADTLAELGLSVVDLDLPEDNLVWDTTVLAGRLMERLRPGLIVAHEEFAALVAAGALGIPAVFITHWFLEAETFAMQALRHASDVIFLDGPGRFAEPEHVAGKVHYVGPVVRDFDYGPSDRTRCCEELGIPADARVVSVLPGSWTEAVAPIFDLVVGATRLLGDPAPHLLWLAGEDAPDLAERCEALDRVRVEETSWKIDRLMVASDLAVTKANRNTVVELDHLGIPSISLTHHLNPMDDRSVAGIPTTRCLDAATIGPERLAACMRSILAGGDPGSDPTRSPTRSSPGAAAAAAAIIGRRLQAASPVEGPADGLLQARGPR